MELLVLYHNFLCVKQVPIPLLFFHQKIVAYKNSVKKKRNHVSLPKDEKTLRYRQNSCIISVDFTTGNNYFVHTQLLNTNPFTGATPEHSLRDIYLQDVPNTTRIASKIIPFPTTDDMD